jgi:hypothetical protein
MEGKRKYVTATLYRGRARNLLLGMPHIKKIKAEGTIMNPQRIASAKCFGVTQAKSASSTGY